jgi:predicted nucleotidyltransferase component of viral defense system
MITQNQLTLINRRMLKYPLDIAEKDYYLAVAAKLISESALGSQLVFKGGTALHHCYLPQHRFSEDLDYTSLVAGLELATVVAMLQSTGEFQVRKQFESTATVKIERLWYAGILAQPGAIKVEIDCKQNVVLPPVQRPYANVWGIEATVATMQIEEIAAEKVRAAATRARYRDFYDLYLLQEQAEVDMERALSLLKQKEIRAQVGPEEIRRNWQQAQQEASDDLRSIYTTRTVEDEEITRMIAKLQFEPLLPPIR